MIGTKCLEFFAVERGYARELTGKLQVGDKILAIGKVHFDLNPEQKLSECTFVCGSGAAHVQLTNCDPEEVAASVIRNPEQICHGWCHGDSVAPFEFEITRKPQHAPKCVLTGLLTRREYDYSWPQAEI